MRETAAEGPAPEALALRLEVVPGIAQVPRAAWEELSPADDPMWTWSFFLAMEEGGVGPDGFEYLVWRTTADAPAADGRIAAILPAFWFRALPLQSTMEPAWQRRIGAVQRVLPGFLAIGAYFCGHPLGRGRILVRRGPGAPDGRQVLAAVRQRAARLGLRWAVVKDLPAAAIDGLLPHLGGSGFFPVGSLPEAVLALPAGTFDDYLAGRKLKARRNIRSKMRRFAAAGLRIEQVEDFAPLVPSMFELYERVMARARVKFDRLRPGFFAALAAASGLDRRLIAVWEGERLAGFLLCLFTGPGGVCLRVGFDGAAAATRDSRLYFALHYEGIRAALDHGCRELSFCQTSYSPKLEMGCGLLPLAHLATHTSAVLRPLIRRTLPELIRRQQQVFQPPTPEVPA